MYQTSYRPSGFMSTFPPVIKNLLIINVLVFMAQQLPPARELLLIRFALWPLSTPGGLPEFLPWQLVSYGFLHGGLTHLLFNMFALWMFGVQIENTWGSRRFAFYYFACVIGAGLVQLAATAASPVAAPTIGASGGVFGILLAFGMLFPNQIIVLLFPPIPMKAKWLVIGYGVLEFFFATSGSQPGVANAAHLGGMLFGLVLILYWRGKLPIQPRRRMFF